MYNADVACVIMPIFDVYQTIDLDSSNLTMDSFARVCLLGSLDEMCIDNSFRRQ